MPPLFQDGAESCLRKPHPCRHCRLGHRVRDAVRAPAERCRPRLPSATCKPIAMEHFSTNLSMGRSSRTLHPDIVTEPKLSPSGGIRPMWKRLALASVPSVAVAASLLVAPETALAQAVKPRFTLILDTSSSMVENTSGTDTFGDGSTGYEGCDRDNAGATATTTAACTRPRAPSPTPSPRSARRSSPWPGSAAPTWARPAPPPPSARPSPPTPPA